jgi:hypothetical protein
MQRTACSARHATRAARGMRHSHTTCHPPKQATRGTRHAAKNNDRCRQGDIPRGGTPAPTARCASPGQRSARASRERARPWRWLAAQVHAHRPHRQVRARSARLGVVRRECAPAPARACVHARCALRAPVCGPTSKPLAAQAPTTRRNPARTRAPDQTPARRRRTPPPPPPARRRARFGARSRTGGPCGSCSRGRHGRLGRRRRRSARRTHFRPPASQRRLALALIDRRGRAGGSGRLSDVRIRGIRSTHTGKARAGGSGLSSDGRTRGTQSTHTGVF